MIYLLLILILIVAICLIFLNSKLNIIVEYRNSKIRITFRCLFVKVSIDGSKFKNNKKTKSKNAETKIEKNSYLDKIKGFKTSYTDIKDILEEILLLTKNKAEFSGIYIRIRYGTGDAAITGSIYGGIWAITGSIYSFLCRFFKVGFPTLELEPVFGGKAFEFEAEGIITTKLVHIITAIFRSINIYYKRKKKKECN